MASPFEAFGYTVNKLQVDEKGCRSTQDVVAGTPLLVLPLHCCWTARAVDKECPQVAQALAKAAARHPELDLQSAATKIALHLIWEHRQLQRSPEATAAPEQERRRKHLELLGGPRSRKAETLLAWGRRDLDALQGSFWFEEAHRRQEEIVADLQSLLVDLGPHVSLALGLINNLEEGTLALQGEMPRESVEVYAWSRWILQELGLQFLLPGGDRLEVLAPGLEVVPRASGANGVLRLETMEGSPALVLSAERDLKAGDEVRLWHKGLACSQGFRLLLGVDEKLKAEKTENERLNACDSVEVLLRLPVSAKNTSENAQLWSIIEALEMALQASRPWLPNEELMPGDALPPDYGWRRVEVLQKELPPETALPSQEDELLEVEVRMPFSPSVPTSDALHQLGLLICADVERMQKVMKEEKGVLDPLGPQACCRRALAYLARTLQWVLEEYPSHASTDARQLSRTTPKDADGPPRRVRGLLLVAAERQLLVEASVAIRNALEAEVETPVKVEKVEKPTPSEAKDTVYSFDWDDGEMDKGSAKDLAIPAAQFSVKGSTDGSRSPLKSRSRKAEGMTTQGATWEDLALEPLLGFSLPVLCDVLWRMEQLLPPAYSQGLRPMKPGYVQDSENTGMIFPPVPKFYERRPSPLHHSGKSLVAKEGALQSTNDRMPSSATGLRWGLLELPGGATPNLEVINALMSVGCEDRLLYLHDELVLQQKYLPRLSSGQHPGTTGSSKAKTAAYDVLVIPLEGWLSSRTPEQLCVDLVRALQALVMDIGASVLRVILLSSLSVGPGSSTYRRDTVTPPAAAVGVVRTARAELPQVPMLWLDTDAEDGNTFQDQLMYEVDLALPPGGQANPSPLERAQCLMAHNRDVVYRQGRRWLPRLDLSPNMPIYAGRVVPELPPHLTEIGVALITGGVGGLGLAAAEALVELGMKCLVLTSRQGKILAEEGAQQRVQAMKSNGTQVIIEACDVAVESNVRELLERIQEHGPLRLVIHASGITEDRPFMEQDGDSFRKVFEPKALGAWYLHRHTLDDKLQNFILFSSVAASRGSSHQANYAAANAYLDELARLRTSHGLPAVSIQWPAVAPWLEEPEEAPSVAIWNGVATGLEKKTNTSSISLAVVRQVVKLSVLNLKSIEPVQAVLPGAYLSSTSPTVRSLLHPLLIRGDRRQEREENSMGLAADHGPGRPMSGTKLCLQLT